MSIKHPLRLIFLVLLLLFFATAIILKILNIINSNEYKKTDHLKLEEVPANRGNIYTYNHKLLAVTSLTFDVRMDVSYANSISSSRDIQLLADDLSRILKNKTKEEYINYLGKNTNNRYLLLARNVLLSDILSLKTINFYKKDLRGGIRIEEYLVREKPHSNLAARTIGDLYKDTNMPKYGIEYSYNSVLAGQDGRSLFLYEPGAGKRVINSSNNIEAQPGKDLITTIDINLQDILEQSLLRQLEKYEANYGTAILMEVETGQIKAISNLQKTDQNKYAEILNFAVTRQVEPGSTIKLASIMAYLEDFDGELHDTIDCKNGKFRFKGAPIDTKDSKKMGVVTIKEAFAQSSNIGLGRLINKYYQEDPQKFIDRLYNFGLAEKSHIDLRGVPEPNIISPSDKMWSGIALPWMSYGYGISLTPLDILTFYNAVANYGYWKYPYLGYALKDGGKINKIIRDTISHRICSKSTAEKVNILLREVVLSGTAKKLEKLPFKVSGKTGTAVKSYSVLKNQSSKEYQSSFVGFFPSDQPKYSCIVLVDSPNQNIGYYGAEVASPVFQEIATKIYSKEGLSWSQDIIDHQEADSTLWNMISRIRATHNDTCQHSYYPNVTGMHVSDALYLLESCGHKVIIKGNVGSVKKQYPKPNSRINKKLAITLFI